MPNFKTLPLLATMALLLVFAIVACTPEEQSDLPPFPDPSSFDTEDAMADPGPIAFDTSDGAFDDSEVTVEQILQRARFAASEIDSYKSRSTVTTRSSTSGFGEPTLDFSEHASNGNSRSGTEHPHPYNDDVFLSEYRTVGRQNFSFHSSTGWEESSEPRPKPKAILASRYFLSLLDMNDINLRSTDERSEDGTKVYRLEFSERHEQPTRGAREYAIQESTHTLLVSKESFRIVAWIQDSHADIYSVSAASEIDSDTHSRGGDDFRITEYYDFNEPVVIEVPDEYVPWSDDAVLSSAIAP